MKKSIRTVLSLLLVVLVAVFLLMIEQNKAQHGMLLSVLEKGAILAVVAVAVHLLNGFTGLFSLGQAGFMLIGAYTTAILLIPVDAVDSVYYMNGINPGIKAFKTLLESAPAPVQTA